MCEDLDSERGFVMVSAHCMIPFRRNLAVLAHGLIVSKAEHCDPSYLGALIAVIEGCNCGQGAPI